MKEKKFKGSTCVLFLFLATLFVTYFSTSTSPLYEGFGYDSAVFQVMGKYFLEGKIPIMHLFDHKGPLIHFVNAVGYMLTGTKHGIWFIQIMNMFLFLVGVYMISRIAMTHKLAIIWSILTMAFLGLCYDGGNLTEEYALPLLALSTYFQYRYIIAYQKEQEVEHNWHHSIWYGIIFAICTFTRLTNAIGLCSGIFVILCILIKEKAWKNIWKNIEGVLLGISVITIPLFIYYGVHNGISDLLMGTFQVNIDMATSVANYWWSESRSITSWIRIIIAHFASYGLILGGILLILKGKKIEAFYCVCVGGIMTLYLVTRYPYYHYMIISVVYLPIVVSAIANMQTERHAYRLHATLAMLISFFVLYQGFNVYQDYGKESQREADYARYVEMIPKQERDSFIAYNSKSALYLEYDIKPYYSFFHHQDYIASRTDEMKEKILKEYKEGDVKWILYEENEHENCINDILNEKYELIASDNKYCLYCRK